MCVLGDFVRRIVYIVFIIVCGLGICFLFFLRKLRDLVRNEYNVIKFLFEISNNFYYLKYYYVM